jgi:hypothetical protein
MDVGTDVVETATQVCEALVDEFSPSTVFAGKVIFRHEHLFQKMLTTRLLLRFSSAFSGRALRL